MSTLSFHEALSGTLGSISLAAWIFILVPQLFKNYQSGNADGISLAFLIVWFIGDLANVFGAVWAGLVPTVIALAVYFCIADTILISQCLYYQKTKNRRQVLDRTNAEDLTRPLLSCASDDSSLPDSNAKSIDHHVVNPETPLISDCNGLENATRSWIKNFLGVVAVCAAGVAGWALAWRFGAWRPTPETANGGLANSFGASILGYLSAICYLGARVPQILKNFREKSCGGLSLLFFILSLLGNLSYGGSILFHSISRSYLIINLPWLVGSLGTMGEDVLIFIQFHIYAKK